MFGSKRDGLSSLIRAAGSNGIAAIIRGAAFQRLMKNKSNAGVDLLAMPDKFALTAYPAILCAAPASAKAEPPPASALSSASAGAKRLALGAYNHPLSLLLRLGVGLWCVRQTMPKAKEFFSYSHQLAEGFSQPSIMFKARLNTGEEIMVDDYREAYWWLRDHTPKDARVMAWWDYGYQINGIAERTSIADGNTWNHEP